MKFSVFQMSRIGGRKRNEDRVGYTYTRDSALFVLGDGMGGHPDGDKAAYLALQTVSNQFHELAAPVLTEAGQFLHDSILRAHTTLLDYARKEHLEEAPRTTLVACVLQQDVAVWAHCGDSRLYFVRDGKLLQRTRDHSYAELQKRLAPKTGDQEILNRNVLYTCLGSPGLPVVDLSEPVHVREGDRFLLCSDGLWDNLSDDVIVSHLAQGPLNRVVPTLVELALSQGGEHCDNVSAVAMEWQQPTGTPAHGA